MMALPKPSRLLFLCVLLCLGWQRRTDAFTTISSTSSRNLYVPSYHDCYYSPRSRRRPSLRLEQDPSEQETAADATNDAPGSRFWRSLYKGLTFPFPNLRALTLAPTDHHKHKAAVKIGFSMKEATLAIAIYLGLGVVAYHSVEGPWSIIDALYFSVVTFTTVGYGDLCPTSSLGKLFTILFGISGISLLGIAIATIGSRLAEIEGDMVKKARKASRERLKRFWHRVAEGRHSKKRNRKKTKHTKTANSSTAASSTGTASSSTSDELSSQLPQRSKPVGLWRKTLQALFTKSIPAFGVIILGGIAMGRIEGWSLVDSVYYAFITAVTLGYGDFSPATSAGKLFAIIFIPLAVAAAGDVLGNVATSIQERRQEMFYESLMQEELDMARLQEMDTAKDGKVSQLEYIEYMLKEMGLVSEEELAELHTQFAKLDKDGSGSLDKDDLQARYEQQTDQS